MGTIMLNMRIMNRTFFPGNAMRAKPYPAREETRMISTVEIRLTSTLFRK